MEKVLTLALLLQAAFILLMRELPSASAQVLCRSQLNLANEACSLRSFVPGARRPGLPREQLNETSVTTTPAAAAAGRSGGEDQELQSREDDGGDDGDDDGYSGRQSSRHHHRHYSEEDDPRDTACCRRIMGLDNSCVCQVTARLPPFMNSIRHAIKLTPIQGCDVTFDCPGPLF